MYIGLSTLFLLCNFTQNYADGQVFYIMLILNIAAAASTKTFPGVIFLKMLKSLITGSSSPQCSMVAVYPEIHCAFLLP
jgi:hypothetical protein